jgi:hypothetical protein
MDPLRYNCTILYGRPYISRDTVGFDHISFPHFLAPLHFHNLRVLSFFLTNWSTRTMLLLNCQVPDYLSPALSPSWEIFIFPRLLSFICEPVRIRLIRVLRHGDSDEVELRFLRRQLNRLLFEVWKGRASKADSRDGVFFAFGIAGSRPHDGLLAQW